MAPPTHTQAQTPSDTAATSLQGSKGGRPRRKDPHRQDKAFVVTSIAKCIENLSFPKTHIKV